MGGFIMRLIDTYQQHVGDLLYKVRTTQRETIEKAAEIIAKAVEKGNHVYLDNICHHIQHDVVDRGGGPTFYQFYKPGETELKEGDVLFLSSVSGRTLSVVNLAYDCVEKGINVIAFTSMEYAKAVDPVHPSGKKLYEIATITMDNCAPAAEAMVEVEGIEARFAAASGIASAFILWSITACVVEIMLADGYTPGILKSANYPGGRDYNQGLYDHYKEFGW